MQSQEATMLGGHISCCGFCVNYRLRSGWLEFVRRFVADKGKSTSVLSTLNLHPGATHPVCSARINENIEINLL
jgi:hypothetical protein